MWSILAQVRGLNYFGLEAWMVKNSAQFGGVPFGFPSITLGDLRDGVFHQSVLSDAIIRLWTAGRSDAMTVIPADFLVSKLASPWMIPVGTGIVLETGANFIVFLLISFFMTGMINLLAEFIVLGAHKEDRDLAEDPETPTIIRIKHQPDDGY